VHRSHSAAAVSSCADQRSHTQARLHAGGHLGNLRPEVGKAQVIINYLLGTLQPGDSLAVARVKSRSFSEKDIIARSPSTISPPGERPEARLQGQD